MDTGWGAEEQRRADERRRRASSRLARQGEGESEFDREFWRSIPPEERVEMLWDLVLEVRRIRGEPGDEPRLQRSVLRVERL